MSAQAEPTQDVVNKFVGDCHGNLASVKAMLEEYPSLVHGVSNFGETGIQAAAHMRQRAIAEHLLAAGAPLDICTATMLEMRDRVVEMLDEDPGLNAATGAHGIPVMAYAALAGSIEMAEILLARGAAVDAGDGANTPLHCAAIFDHDEMARWLLNHGARTDAKDYSGLTPVDVAERMKRPKVSEVLREWEGTGAGAATVG